MKAGFEDLPPKRSPGPEAGPLPSPKARGKTQSRDQTPLASHSTAEGANALELETVRRLNANLEERVSKLATQLEAAHRELEAFSYSVSHDLRAPLRHILGFAKLLRAETGDQLSTEGLQCLERVTGSAQRLERLIDDLLGFSRTGRQEMRLSQVDLQTLVQEAMRQLEPETRGRNIRWKAERLPQVKADAAMLRQVVANLLSNAVKFSRGRDPAEIQIGCAAGGPQETVIFVRDNGVGFNMRYAGPLFGVFQRLHSVEDFQGTGMGLALVRRIISRHGGRTWAEGEVNRGATFYFSLPKS
jgi:light-regulated signal transduction histidine kinase (bacteriophytochrome)